MNGSTYNITAVHRVVDTALSGLSGRPPLANLDDADSNGELLSSAQLSIDHGKLQPVNV